MSLLEIRNVHTQFRTQHGVIRAVDGVSFNVEAGETVGLVGESGCGKSVTALSIMRLVPSPPGSIESGEILLDGDDILTMTEAEVRRIRGARVAMVFQDPMTSLNPVMTVGQQIAEALRLHLGLPRRQAMRRAVELLEMVGIPAPQTRIRDYPHQFSGGMRQRVMIAMALSCNPKLVLADEVTTALDVTVQAQILELLRSLAAESGTAFVIITHDLGIVAGMTQRVHVMYAGRIVESAPTTELFDRPRMPYTWGLLKSVPRLDEERRQRLVPIEGSPPDLSAPPPGCRFEPRCPYRRDICGQREPELLSVDAGSGVHHETRCWGTQAVDGGGWLIDHDWQAPDDGLQRDDSAWPVTPPTVPGGVS